jgi:hypothetical protein
MKSLLTGAALVALLAAAAPSIEVAVADQCRDRCQSIENQCRMASKDLDSSKCNAKFLACIASCRGGR